MQEESSFRHTLRVFNEHKVIFSVFFIIIFASSFTLLYMLDLVPSELEVTDITTSTVSSSTIAKTAAADKVTPDQIPLRITIAKIGTNAIVQNPSTANPDKLDALLLKGAVRYPGSGFLGKGNLFLFAHSTGFKIVNNQAFKTFNNLKDLVKGDQIVVYSESKAYTYSVRDVTLVDSSAEWVDFSTKTNMLTLSTCNTFGKKEERYVVQADFVKSQDLL